MPTSYIQKMAEKHNKTVDYMESKWARAKSKVDKSNYSDSAYYAIVTTIFKRMIGEDIGILSFEDYIRLNN
jgi:hypothetical protein